ncbi:MAG: hypothetical protein Q4E63_04040 [Prevotellaceae bacterium]|nr:hypothetical protein [Prevotellaceae bacterium]
MANKDFIEDKAAQFGAGLTTIGLFGKAAVITKGIGVTAAIKCGVFAGGFISAPFAVGLGLCCIGAGVINHYGKFNWW